MINAPFFTVVIPTYNRAELLKEAVLSVLGQTFQEFELIIVDDHSTDKTKEVVGTFKDDRIIYVLNDRGRGGAGTRNAGIFRARGEWVAFLDDDDIWLPEKLALFHKKAEEVGDSAGLIYSGLAHFDFKNKRCLSSSFPEKEGWMQRDILYKNYIGTFSVVAARKNILQLVGGLDEDFKSMQDMELYARLARMTRVALIREKLSCIRLTNADRISLSVEKKLESSILFWEKNKEYINKDPKLRHRAASRVLMYALQQGDMKAALKSLPWTLSGVFLDISNLFKISRSVIAFYYRKYKITDIKG